MANLKDENKHLTKEFFTIPNVEQGFSTYTPNVVFSHNEENFAKWNLEKIDFKIKDEYFLLMIIFKLLKKLSPYLLKLLYVL